MKIENFIAQIVHPHFPSYREVNDNVASSYDKARVCGATYLDKENGFTLIEVIVTLVFVAILSTMIYTYFGSSITQSGMPVIRIGKAMEIQTVIENIVADYKRLNDGSSYDIATLKSRIAATPGTTGSGNYGGIGTSAISYTVVDNKYIKYDLASCTSTTSSCPEQDDTSGGNNYLKVTVKGNTGETLTQLFCK